ncbi:MAG TPA: GNAT family N-acetyltransferase, partial [Mobilitalea sp.]|nr:GNAT family N-acetyltransferase [Mobilitalea sp.]
SCEEVWKHSTFVPLKDIEQAKSMLDNLIHDRASGEYTFMALHKKDGNEFIGEAGIIGCNPNSNRCVIGYNLLPQYWKKGYATEITRDIVKYVFEGLRLERVEALALQINTASCRVLEKSGFLLEGVLRNYNHYELGYRNVCYYGLISSDFYK